MIRKLKWLLPLSLVLVGLWGVLYFLSRPILETRGYSRAVYDRDGRLLRLTLSGDEKYRIFTPLKEIDPTFVEAVLLHEDRHFRSHAGVNPVALVRAAYNTYVDGERRMGGSTITMQLARMTSTRGSKTVVGKLFQIARALELELFHSKNEILEAYLNLLPYGANIEGIGAATLIYFGKPPSHLTLNEALSLATIPQNPIGRKIGGELNRRSMERLFAEWCEVHPEAQTQKIDFDLPLNVKKIGSLPFLAPHFVNLVLEREFGSSHLRTTLSLPLQKMLESKVRAFIAAKKPLGVSNAAAMIVDSETMEVVALIGSASFFDAEIFGQVNGVTAKRSPGSLLKPFVYTLAFDQGLIHPHTLMKDTPMSFSGFDPENFDKKFTGPVKATEALIRSRNIPAVYLASLLEKPSFYEFLKSNGVSDLREAGFYGAALPLGGAEVTMEEVLRLYGALANRGRLQPLKYYVSQKLEEEKQIFSAEAAFITLDMLRQNPRYEGWMSDKWTMSSTPVAWKTGTSKGFRDAWTAGLSGKYLIAVWLGNFDGERNPAFVGRDLAAPLLFSVADGLRKINDSDPAWTSPVGLNLKKVKVCAVSGMLPGPHCKHKEDTWFIPGESPIETCNIHREILISKNSGKRLCDEADQNAKHEVFEFWPSDLLQVFKLAGLSRKGPPPYAPECASEITKSFGIPPNIISPKKSVIYKITGQKTETDADSETVPLMAVTDGDVNELSWFIGGEFVGKTAPQKPLHWHSRPGKFVVRVVDDLGRYDSRELLVKISD